MVSQPVEWVLVIYYGPSAHRATYGRFSGPPKTYTKDFIQLSREAAFMEAVTRLFPIAPGFAGSVPLTYKWPMGSAPGALIFKSADRPHLKWETSLGAPKAWKMASAPSDSMAETIPGNPSHTTIPDAEKEFAQLSHRGAGQPFLMAIKLRDEARTLHLRAYLKNPSTKYAWANLALVPSEVEALAAKTTRKSALAWSLFGSGGIAPSEEVVSALSRLAASKDMRSVIDALDVHTGRALADYLRDPGHGLFFDTSQNHDAWLQPSPLPSELTSSIDSLLQTLEAKFPPLTQSDAAAEALEVDSKEVELFRDQIAKKNYEVEDSTATVKTRGSAQRAFAGAVKANYGNRCAITGILTKDFLIASHIVPWSDDASIRIDPSNGICLSALVDRAFEKGYIQIEDDLTIRVDWDRVGEDEALRGQLEPYDRTKLKASVKEPPQPEYLRRRRALVSGK